MEKSNRVLAELKTAKLRFEFFIFSHCTFVTKWKTWSHQGKVKVLDSISR